MDTCVYPSLYPSILCGHLSIHFRSFHPFTHLSCHMHQKFTLLSVHRCIRPPMPSSSHPVVHPYPFFRPLTLPSLSTLLLIFISLRSHPSTLLLSVHASTSLSCCTLPTTVHLHTLPFGPLHIPERSQVRGESMLGEYRIHSFAHSFIHSYNMEPRETALVGSSHQLPSGACSGTEVTPTDHDACCISR